MRHWLRRFRRRPSDEEFATELESHLAHLTDEHRDRGLPPEEARYAALRVLGNVTRHRERFRETSPWFWLDTLWQDVRYGWRSLWRTPVLTIVAVVSLAVGIGANAAVYTVVRAVLLEPLRLPEVHRTFFVHDTNSDVPWMPIAYQEQIARLVAPFGHAGPWIQWQWPVRYGNAVSQQWVLFASEGATTALGFDPRVGRWPTAQEQRAGAALVVLTHRLWQEYGSNLDVLGRELRIANRTFTVIGVAPPEFRGIDVGVPYGAIAPFRSLEALKPGTLRVMPAAMLGRLAPSHSIEAAAQQVASWQLEPVSGTATAPRLRLLTPRQALISPERAARLTRILGGVSVVAGLVLLLGCCNLASVMLARAEVRRRELAMRITLGATRARVIRFLSTEFAVLTVLCTAAAVVVSRWMLPLVPTAAVLGYDEVVVLPFDLTWSIVLFTAGLGVASCAIFGVIPAIRSTSLAPGSALRSGGDTRSTTRARSRQVLLAVQVGAACVLLVSTLLVQEAVSRATAVGLGYETRDTVLFAPVMFIGAREQPHRIMALRAAITERLRSHPLFVSSAFTFGAEAFRPPRLADQVIVDGVARAPVGGRVFAEYVEPAFRHTVGLPLLRGRDLTADDATSAAPAVLINDALARQFWPRGEAVGSRLQLHFPGPPGWDQVQGANLPGLSRLGWTPAAGSARIVGVVGNLRVYVKTGVAPAVYFAWGAGEAQVPIGGMYVRMRGPRLQAASAVREAIHATVPDEPPPTVISPDQYVSHQLTAERAARMVLAWFAGVALVLSVVGVYGIASHSVVRRGRELAIRLALGCSPRAVARLVVKSALMPVLMGMRLGNVAAAACAAVLLRPFIVGVEPLSLAVFVIASAVLMGVAFAALYWPTRTAARIDPAVTLKSE